MITRKGTVVVGNELAFYPFMEEPFFLKSRFGKQARMQIENKSFHTYALSGLIDKDIEANFLLIFRDNILVTVIVAPIWEKIEGWGEWSENKELMYRDLNDALLRRHLGPGPYLYSWGKIWSGYEAKSGESTIVVTYE